MMSARCKHIIYTETHRRKFSITTQPLPQYQMQACPAEKARLASLHLWISRRARRAAKKTPFKTSHPLCSSSPLHQLRLCIQVIANQPSAELSTWFHLQSCLMRNMLNQHCPHDSRSFTSTNKCRLREEHTYKRCATALSWR
ncbi:hypothetical protein COCSUDRAFT_34534 [Coccomyxa subellipsoidea C-169]|uniref:Uncharacterized protein n=1 Tax=Coccomyxa subellipsoidea (strain C-169) TaxID=574566 RepID=I0YIV6_COCSC|nr:hypothetical protein COCSUDRAFT_34534 [Coccomyxa subellipsoidea C-169]EIE18325.1 hypothetical protein COCSUDRAFT_34534 [Coccomyxa subellipsoidea C-169]|eukprot:XP_005642869.1 hypothetical protein COCSUDRAFT_34534 [Coccomyxa subellipsoidea C-169]